MDKGTIIRTLLFLGAWINSFLVSKGYETLPALKEEEVALLVAFTISIWTWYKNNYVTKKGKKQKEILEKHSLK